MPDASRKDRTTTDSMTPEPTTAAGDPAATIDPAALRDEAGRVAAAHRGLTRTQAEGVAFLTLRRRAILADDEAIDPVREAAIAMTDSVPAGPILVICPAARVAAWTARIASLAPADAGVDGGLTPAPHARWTVATHEQLARQGRTLERTAWAGLIVDEAQRIRNEGTRTRFILRLAGVDRGIDGTNGPTAVYLLTDPAMPERSRELFNLLRVVRHPLAVSFRRYALRYCAAVENGYGLDADGASNADELAARIAGVRMARTARLPLAVCWVAPATRLSAPDARRVA